jgi:hypothetical protein
MVARLERQHTFRVMAHRRNQHPIAHRLTSVTDRASLAEIEAMTNPRIQQEYAARKKIRPDDLIGGDGNEMVIAAFTYSGASRFTDGSFGVYYAGTEFTTAVAESAYHTERFLSYTNARQTSVYKRVLTANIDGSYDDLRSLNRSDPIYDPNPENYATAQAYGLRAYASGSDGIVYESVRAPGGTCVAAFRPRLISKCTTAAFLAYSYNGKRIDDMFRIETLDGI